MSSTGRLADRSPHDYYVTPENDVRMFLSEFLLNENIDRPDNLAWVDPCAGGDEHRGMAYADVIEKEFAPMLDTYDIREDSRAEHKLNYLAANDLSEADIVISNPPFNLAEDFLRKALTQVVDGGYVCLLLRLNFFGSHDRKALFAEHMPDSVYIHPDRISFTLDNKADSIEYAHFVWKKGSNPKFSKTYLLEGHSKETRKEMREAKRALAAQIEAAQ